MISDGPNGVIGNRPDAPYDLADAGAEVWRAIVASMPAEHFAPSHYPMLTQLCRHKWNPIGLDDVPLREEWQLNEARSSTSPSIFKPPSKFAPRLIEPAIRINAKGGLSASEIKSGAEVIKAP
jgi:hypothetical protein